MKPLTARYTFRFDVEPEALWRAVSDTDAVNRDAGLPAVRYTFEEGADGRPVLIAHARLGPLSAEWEEPPFTWEAPHRLAVVRRFRGGPFTRFTSDVRIVADGSGARIEHAVELEPRNAVGRLIAPAVLARGHAGAARAYGLAAQRARDTPPVTDDDSLAVPDVAPAAPWRVARFVDALRALRALDKRTPAIAARLASLVEHGDDATVARMRPYVLADSWSMPRDAVLAAMLAATRGGLLDLSWTLICPSCRGPKNRVASLAEIGPDVHCGQCGITYGADFDRNVEVTFDAQPSGRTAAPPVYCIAGPQTARQTRAQSSVPPRTAVGVTCVLRPGAYVVQALPDRAVRFAVSDGGSAAPLDVRVPAALPGERTGRLDLSARDVRAGTVRVRIVNDSESTALVRITEAELSAQIATAADVTAMQAFRDLFSSEVLAGGRDMAIRSLTILFSDVVGSTRMYAETGDARAFRVVSEHFDALHGVIAEHRGAIVKTIGDAVMAVFTDPVDAVQAALRFAPAVAPLQLRIGMHRGPCIAMRANDRLDYFGATVNIASRVGHAAGAGEVLVTTAIADLPGVGSLLRAGERDTVALRGVPHPVEVVRMRGSAREPVA